MPTQSPSPSAGSAGADAAERLERLNAEAAQMIQSLAAVNEQIRKQVERVPAEKPGSLRYLPPVPQGVVKVPARTAQLIATLERSLGKVPATVVIDGSYVEVYSPKPDDAFFKALAATSSACMANFDLQVEQTGTMKLSTTAESYRRRIQMAGGPAPSLALMSRWSERSTIRFTFAPRRMALTQKRAEAGSKPPAQVKEPARVAQMAANSSSAQSQPKEGHEVEVGTKRAIAGEVPPIPLPASPDLPPSRQTTAKIAPREVLPEPNVIVIELPRDRGKVSGGESDMVGVVSVEPRP